MGWIIALGVLTLLAMLPLGISVRYPYKNPVVYLTIGPLRFLLYSAKRKKAKKQMQTNQTASDKVSEKTQKTQDFWPLLKGIFEFLTAFRRKLIVKNLEIKLTLAGDDPSDLAQNYGRAWAALGNVMPLLEQSFYIKKRDLSVDCDFAAERTLLAARLDIAISLGRLLVLLMRYGLRIILECRDIFNHKKGGAQI